MALIYIDTNIFLDFYQTAKDRLAVFSEIEKRADLLILPDQTKNEFYRNRIARLLDLQRNIIANEPKPFMTAVVRELIEFSEWTKARTDVRRHAKAIKARLDSWIQDDSSDPVCVAFSRLAAAAKRLPITDEAVRWAFKRKLLGDPPTSRDRHSVGDELIWELLLESCKEDLIIVSRDQTFLDNVSLLKREFERGNSRKLLLITPSLNDALKQIGTPSETIEIAEKALPEACPKCGGEMEETGYEGSDGDEAWWMYCKRCGHEEFPN
jgi:hypothetical protein